MSKKKKNKDISKLRAQVEFLKAQLKTRSGASSWREEALPNSTEHDSSPIKAKEEIAYQLNPTLLRNDLRRIFLLTFFASLLLVVAYFTQSYWPTFGAAVFGVWKRG